MPRRMIQRAFLKWFELNRPRFAIEIKLGRRTDRNLELSFAGINGAVTAALTTYEINVYVEYESYNWDMILSVDSVPIRIEGGYYCAFCLPESRSIFPDRLSLYTDHLFEPFLKWVNDDLAKAKWLMLEGKPDHATSARLMEELPGTDKRPNGEVIFIPIRTDAL